MYNIKHYYILYAILSADEKHAISSKQLSEELSLSNKTIQSSILLLHDYANNYGFEIVSKSGSGFYPRIYDKYKVASLKQNLAIYFSRNFIIEDNDALKVCDFSIYIAARDIPLSVNKLCDKFFLSKSTVYAYLSKTRILMDRPGMQLVNDSGKGIFVECNEFIKRAYIAFCLANNIFQYDLDFLFGYDFHFFNKSTAYSVKLITLLKKYNISFTDDKYNILTFYISYSNYRYQHNHLISDDYLRDSVSNFKEYQIAKELARTLNLFYSQDKYELAALASYIITFKDNVGLKNKQDCGDLYDEVIELYEYLKQYLTGLSSDIAFISDFESSLFKLSFFICALYRYDFYIHNLTNIYLNNLDTPNALVRYMARLITARINEYFGKKIAHKHTNAICLFCQNLLYSAQKERSDIRILMILKEGGNYKNYVVSWLNEHLIPKPIVIDQMSLYEANIYNIDQYDIILSDYKNLNSVQINRKVHFISDPIDKHCAFLDEYYNISNKRCMSFGDIIDCFESIKVYRDCQLERTENFLVRLDSDLDGYGNIPIREVRKLGYPINYYGGNKVLIVPYIYREQHEHKRILCIYFNDNKKVRKYDILVFFSLYADYSMGSLSEIMNLCNEFYVNPDIFSCIANHISK